MKSQGREGVDDRSRMLCLDFMQSIDLGIKLIFTIVFVSLVTLFYLFVHDLATQSAYFKIEKISLTGEEILDRSEILKRAGVSLKDNLLDVNLSRMKKRLISHPWIRDVSLERKIPDELVLRVREERALGVVRIGNCGDVLINSRGKPFKEYVSQQDNPDHSLPVITGLELSERNGRYWFSEQCLQPVLALLSLGMKEKILRVHVDEQTGVAMETTGTNGHLTVNLGFGRYREKLKKKEQIFDYVRGNIFDKKVCSIDLFNLESAMVSFEEPDSKSRKGGV
ncbi:MAG: FtsQ-type POTRA domain-containing protein [Desulfobacteraceae bacterium]